MRLSIGGPFWGRKGWPEIIGYQTTLELDARRQHIVVTPFNGVDRRSTFDGNPERIVVHTNDGVAVERRDDPRASFVGYEVTTPWDALQVGYFISYACWNYLTAPFLFTYPGVKTREVEPWQEDGETWRRLHVTFPRSIVTHNPEQVFYYDADFMQRRMDCAPEVNGDVLVAQYQYGPKTFQGLVFPSHRRIHRRSPDGAADPSRPGRAGGISLTSPTARSAKSRLTPTLEWPTFQPARGSVFTRRPHWSGLRGAVRSVRPRRQP